MGFIIGIVTPFLIFAGFVQWGKGHRNLSKLLFALALLGVILLVLMSILLREENRRFEEMQIRASSQTQNQ